MIKISENCMWKMQFLVGVINQNAAIIEKMAAVQQKNKVNHHILYKKSIKSNSSVFLGIYSTKCQQTTTQKTTTKEKSNTSTWSTNLFRSTQYFGWNFQLNVLIAYRETNLGQTSNQIWEWIQWSPNKPKKGFGG